MSKQKFSRGVRIKVCKEMPEIMLHFHSDFEAIVEGTYAELYGGDNIKEYSLIMLNEVGEPINAVAWYWKSQLTLINDNIEEGLKIIENYKKYGVSEETKKKWHDWVEKHPNPRIEKWRMK